MVILGAGPLYFAASDFQNPINAGMPVSGVDAMKFMNVLLSIMLPYTKGYRYPCFLDGVDLDGG